MNIKNINLPRTFVILLFCMFFIFSATSCVVFSKTNNIKHKGWYKNTNNPHHHNSTNHGKWMEKSNK